MVVAVLAVFNGTLFPCQFAKLSFTIFFY